MTGTTDAAMERPRTIPDALLHLERTAGGLEKAICDIHENLEPLLRPADPVAKSGVAGGELPAESPIVTRVMELSDKLTDYAASLHLLAGRIPT